MSASTFWKNASADMSRLGYKVGDVEQKSNKKEAPLTEKQFLFSKKTRAVGWVMRGLFGRVLEDS